MLWNEEPFGDTREDLRAWAHVCLSMGAKEVRLEWPYIDPVMTATEIMDEIARLERECDDGDRRENQHRD